MSALGQKQTYAVQLATSAKAKSGHRGVSFDHFIGAILYRLRHGDAERLRGLEVEQQLDFACLLDR
jgi:hypothetical protein